MIEQEILEPSAPTLESSPWPRDFVEGYLEYTRDIRSPEILRKWCAISAVACSLERRVWIDTEFGFTFPNLFILLIAGPAIGKGLAMGPAIDILKKAGKINIAPNDMQKAGMLDHLKKAMKAVFLPSGKLFEFHSLAILSTEFGALMPKTDPIIMQTIVDLYDNKPWFEESKRTTKSAGKIEAPQINILGACTPTFLSSILPEDAWSTGFTSRLVLVHSGERIPITTSFFRKKKRDEKLYDQLIDMARRYDRRLGLMEFTEEAEEFAFFWGSKEMPPVPKQTKLISYVGRRLQTYLKLCIISAQSRTGAMLIEIEDAIRAKDWMLEAEEHMGDIFREMINKSDADLLVQMWEFVWREYQRNGAKPVEAEKIYQWMLNNCPVQKQHYLLKAAVAANMLTELAGGANYKPCAREEFGFDAL